MKIVESREMQWEEGKLCEIKFSELNIFLHRYVNYTYFVRSY